MENIGNTLKIVIDKCTKNKSKETSIHHSMQSQLDSCLLEGEMYETMMKYAKKKERIFTTFLSDIL